MEQSVSQRYQHPETIEIAPKKQSFIAVQHLGRSRLLNIADITHLEGVGNYTFIFTANGRYLLSKTLKKVHNTLDANFIRAHKSYIVNRAHIKAFWVNFILLNCGQNIPVARRRIAEIREALTAR
jgi:two-component system LytT family response regulator